jgi:hypothetical protein
MSYCKIDETVKNCIPILVTSKNINIDMLTDAYYLFNSVIITGWTYSAIESKLKTNSEMYGHEITKGNLKVLFVMCEGDDYFYFVGNKKDLITFKTDWNITEPIQHDYYLWSVI